MSVATENGGISAVRCALASIVPFPFVRLLLYGSIRVSPVVRLLPSVPASNLATNVESHRNMANAKGIEALAMVATRAAICLHMAEVLVGLRKAGEQP